MYVYALLDRGGRRVRPSRPIELLDIAGVFAAIERMADRPAVSESALREQHEIVCRLGERFEALLPARFGTWIARAELRRVVESRRETIEQALRLVRGRVQMTLRVDAAAARATLPPATRTGTEYLETRRTAAGAELPLAIAGPVEAATAGLVVAARVESRQRGLAVYHLVDRRSVEAYRAAIETLPPGAAVRMSGPWPAFAFAPDLW